MNIYILIILLFGINSTISEFLFAKDNTLKIGYYPNPPLNLKNNQNEYSGVAIDILKDIATRKHWKLKFIEGEFPNLLEKLRLGEIDILPGIAHSLERSRFINFNQEKIINNWGIIYRNSNNAITDISDLRGLNIAGLEEDIHFTKFKQLMQKKNITFKAQNYKSYKKVLASVENNTANAAVLNRMYAIFKRSSANTVSTLILFNKISVLYGFKLDIDPSIIKTIDINLREQRNQADSVFNKTLNKWLKPAKYYTPIWIKIVIIFILILIVLFILFNKLLKERVDKKSDELIETKKKILRSTKLKNDILISVKTPLELFLLELKKFIDNVCPENSKTKIMHIYQKNLNQLKVIDSMINDDIKNRGPNNFIECNPAEFIQEIVYSKIKDKAKTNNITLEINSTLDSVFMCDTSLIKKMFADVLNNTSELDININVKKIQRKNLNFVFINFKGSNTHINPNLISKLNQLNITTGLEYNKEEKSTLTVEFILLKHDMYNSEKI